MLPPLLDGLTALAPTFYVTGNHEWVLSREKREVLFSMLDAAGVVRLQNEYRLLKKGQASIVLAGVDDPNGPYDQKRPAQLVREIRQSRGRDAYILMLSHRNDARTVRRVTEPVLYAIGPALVLGLLVVAFVPWISTGFL